MCVDVDGFMQSFEGKQFAKLPLRERAKQAQTTYHHKSVRKKARAEAVTFSHKRKGKTCPSQKGGSAVCIRELKPQHAALRRQRRWG